ncbi:hypothetical protein [Kitasatospora sp. NPDC001175]|uniref:hypothetical protein n=1 Tax=Kitasatospora sp. NPDC001175 TaxID=3157103 RepID=UPI003D02DD08
MVVGILGLLLNFSATLQRLPLSEHLPVRCAAQLAGILLIGQGAYLVVKSRPSSR